MMTEPIRIAIVEANQAFRSFYASRLEEESGGLLQVVLRCGNGAELLARLSGARPEVVLMDPVLPVLDGVSTAGILNSLFPEILILAFQYSDDQEQDALLGRSGFSATICKDEDIYQSSRQIRKRVWNEVGV